MVGGEEWRGMTGEGQEYFVEHGDEGLAINQFRSTKMRWPPYLGSFFLNQLVRSCVSNTNTPTNSKRHIDSKHSLERASLLHLLRSGRLSVVLGFST